MSELFSIEGKVAVITGACGVLGGSVAQSFIASGAKVVAIGTKQEKLDAKVKELSGLGGDVIGFVGNVLDIPSLEKIAAEVVAKWGRIDILLNIAGGNIPGATLIPDQSFFEMEISKWDAVTNLNMNGTVYPSYVFGKIMAEQKKRKYHQYIFDGSYAVDDTCAGIFGSKSGGWQLYAMVGDGNGNEIWRWYTCKCYCSGLFYWGTKSCSAH